MVEWALILWTLLTRRGAHALKHSLFFFWSEFLLNIILCENKKLIWLRMWTDCRSQGVDILLDTVGRGCVGIKSFFQQVTEGSPRSVAVFVNGRCKPTLKSLKTHQVSYSLWAPRERPHSLSSALMQRVSFVLRKFFTLQQPRGTLRAFCSC